MLNIAKLILTLIKEQTNSVEEMKMDHFSSWSFKLNQKVSPY